MDPTMQEQAPPMPFTKADELQAQRLQAADSKATEEFNDGNLSETEYGKLKQHIGQRLGPLLQRQQADQQQKKQQMFQEQMEQHAQQEAMAQQAAKMRAEGFHDRVVDYFDPLTNKSAKFYESAPNKWEELKFEESREGQEQEVEVEASDGE